MRQLVWNDELAEIAQRYQDYLLTTNEDSYSSFLSISMISKEPFTFLFSRWINQCAGAHDDNRRTDAFSWVGQNWAMSSNGNKDQQQSLAVSFVQMWYDEVCMN